MKVSKLRQVAVAAEDLDKSLAFYRDKLGARFIGRFDPPGLVFFDLDGTRLLIEKGANKATLYFHVDDIEASCKDLIAAGVTIDSGPHMIFRDSEGMFGPKGEEEWMAFFKDPAGNILAFSSRK